VFGQDAYETVSLKAAALMQSLAHRFSMATNESRGSVEKLFCALTAFA
jgi:hypothetical protein